MEWKTLQGLLLGSLACAGAPSQAGYLVINNDEWTFSSTGFSQSPSAGTFINNITNLFTGDQPGNFLAYSNNFGLTGSGLAAAVTGAGHTWTVSMAAPFTLATLQNYDAVFLGGNFLDQSVIVSYLLGGGNVYIMAGTGTMNGSAAEASAWNQVLASAGLAYETTFNGIGGNVPPVGPHPLLAGISTLYFNNGNTVDDLDPLNDNGEILFALNGQGMLALGQFGELPPPSVFSPPRIEVDIPVPAPATLALIGIGLAGLGALRRRKR
jgi:PEP-CTERM motif